MTPLLRCALRWDMPVCTCPKVPEVAQMGCFGTGVWTGRWRVVEESFPLIVKVPSVWQLCHLHVTYFFTLHHTCSHLGALKNQLTASSWCSHITLHQTGHSFDVGWCFPSFLEIFQGMSQNRTKLDCKIIERLIRATDISGCKWEWKLYFSFNVATIAMWSANCHLLCIYLALGKEDSLWTELIIRKIQIIIPIMIFTSQDCWGSNEILCESTLGK